MAQTPPYLDANKTAPAESLVSITPNDGTDIAENARALYIGGAGDVSVIAVGDSSAVTLTAVSAGTILPIRVKRVLSTGTTATAIVALF